MLGVYIITLKLIHLHRYPLQDLKQLKNTGVHLLLYDPLLVFVMVIMMIVGVPVMIRVARIVVARIVVVRVVPIMERALAIVVVERVQVALAVRVLVAERAAVPVVIRVVVISLTVASCSSLCIPEIPEAPLLPLVTVRVIAMARHSHS